MLKTEQRVQLRSYKDRHISFVIWLIIMEALIMAAGVLHGIITIY